MVTDYKIPMMVYERLMFNILEEYDVKFRRFVYVVKHIVENRYELPDNINKIVTLRMGGVNVYIEKAPHDLFNIEYKVYFRLNYKQFVKYIDTCMKGKCYYRFGFENYLRKHEFINNMSEYIYQKYNIKCKSYITGGYVQFESTVFIHGDTKIIYVE